jgi:hypothetical protein
MRALIEPRDVHRFWGTAAIYRLEARNDAAHAMHAATSLGVSPPSKSIPLTSDAGYVAATLDGIE